MAAGMAVFALLTGSFDEFDELSVILPLADILDEVEEGWARLFASTLVLLVLTSVLPPILRRTQSAAATLPEANGHKDAAPDFFATAVVRIADRIELLNADPGNRSPEIRAEVKRLRELAKSFES